MKKLIRLFIFLLASSVLAQLNPLTNPVTLPNGLTTANNNPIAKASKILIENINASEITGNDANAYISWLYTNVKSNQSPAFFESVVLSNGGDDTNDGSNFQKAVRTYARATELTRAMVGTDHKGIISYDSRNFGDLINNSTTGNTPNLVMFTPLAIYEDVTLINHSTSVNCRRIIGNVVLGNGSNLNAFDIGYTTAKTVTFSAQVHNATRIKARHLNSNTTISFSGVLSGSKIHVEIDRYDSDLATVLNSIPNGVEITGFIGLHVFTDINHPSNTVVQNISQTVAPSHSRLMIGGTTANFRPDGNNDTAHFNDVFRMDLEALKIGNNLSGRLIFEKHVTGVNFPAQYYYRVEGNTIVPTTNGTNTATSNVNDYMGSNSRLFYVNSHINEQITNTSRQHTLYIPNDNFGLPIMDIHQNENLLLVFNFLDFDVTVSSFTANIVVHTNTGDNASKYNGKTRIRFDRVADNRYSMTLGTDTTFDTNPLKVSDVFKKSSYSINLDAGGRTNEVAVNGQVAFTVPYLANAQQLIEINFSTTVVNN